jgi:hypothetical protein
MKYLVNGSCYIFIDESGDLGPTDRSPCHFVLAALCIKDIRRLQRLPRKTRAKFSKRYNIGMELKHHAENEMISKFILNSLASLDVNIYWVALRKSHKKDKQWYRTYQALSCILLEELIATEKASRYSLVVDRFSKKSFHMASYEAMVERILTAPEIARTIPHISIKFVDSCLEPAMQVHDFVVGSIFRSLEWDDHVHLDIIREKVVFGDIVTTKDLFRHRHDEHSLQEK